MGLTRAKLVVLGAFFARMVALGAKAPAISVGHFVAVLVEEFDMVGLLNGAARKTRLVLDQVLELRLGADDVIATHGLVPVPVGARPHRVHAGKPADIA